mmetsp:Transcript_14102/g.44913  ORF Transcript_14102/g.44913 Transcript_14102/m.44913 type:complete len:237 (-) Transcript_14102:2274-2984(-)
MGLSGTGLPVGEDAHIVPVDGALYEVLGVLEHRFLGGVAREDSIELVAARLLLVLPRMLESEIVGDSEHIFLVLVQLLHRHGARARVDADLALHVLHLVEVTLPQGLLLLVEHLKLLHALRLALDDGRLLRLPPLDVLLQLPQRIQLLEVLLLGLELVLALVVERGDVAQLLHQLRLLALRLLELLLEGDHFLAGLLAELGVGLVLGLLHAADLVLEDLLLLLQLLLHHVHAANLL